MLSYARINNCKKWTLTTVIHYIHRSNILWKAKKTAFTKRIWLYCDVLVPRVCVCVFVVAHSPEIRMEFIFYYTCRECIWFGAWWHYLVLLCCVFVHFTTIKRNKIKSNLCHAWCTVHRTSFLPLKTTSRASATAAVFQLRNIYQKITTTTTKKIVCKMLISFFIFFFVLFSRAIIWSLIFICWLSLVVISNIFLHFDGLSPQEISIISFIIAHILKRW